MPDQQQQLDFSRAAGEEAGKRCTEKAVRVVAFDSDGAGKFMLGWLRRHGPTPGEDLTNAAIEHGYRPHDARAFGSIFKKLARDKLIHCTGFVDRKKGHGTAGGRVWKAN